MQVTWSDGLTVVRGDYAAYLRSFAWRALRDRVLERDGGRCVYCGEPAVEVHHENYSRVGREQLDDLSAVCRACHLRAERLRRRSFRPRGRA